MLYTVRITRGEGALSTDVKMVLGSPGVKTPEQDRLPGNVYLEDFLPTTKDHHTELGEFVDAWSRLETTIGFLFIQMAECDVNTGRAIFAGLGMRQVIETIGSLATIKLPNEEIKELSVILERISALNSKRNKIVHGHWVLEVILLSRGGLPLFKSNLLREVDPADFRILKRIHDLRNQKDRVRYTFNAKRIRAASLDAGKIEQDIGVFTRDRLNAIVPFKFAKHQ